MNRLACRTQREAESSDTIDNLESRPAGEPVETEPSDSHHAARAFRTIGSSFANSYQQSVETRFEMQQEVLSTIADTSKEQLLVAKETLTVLQDLRDQAAQFSSSEKENMPTAQLQHPSPSTTRTLPSRIRLNVPHPPSTI